VRFIDRHALADCWQLSEVYYDGTVEECERININGALTQGSDFSYIQCLDGEYYV
jgi:hypothetical protein